MRDIQDDLERWQAEGEEIAIATLVAVRRSAPRLPGARLALTRSGRMAGSVSAGCVENDVFQRAVQVLDNGEPVLTSYGITNELGLQAGLSCGGSIDVLIEPFVATRAWQTIRTAVEENSPAALGIAIAPASLIGRKIAVTADDQVVGSIDPSVDAVFCSLTTRVRVEKNKIRQVIATAYEFGTEVGTETRDVSSMSKSKYSEEVTFDFGGPFDELTFTTGLGSKYSISGPITFVTDDE